MTRLLPITLLLALALHAADITGPYNVTITTPDGKITGKAFLKQNGRTVTGWVGPSESDPMPITGTMKGNKLAIKTSPQPGRDAAFNQCDLTVNGRKLTGTIDTNKGTIEFLKRATP
jgi:hypothetical protein